MKNFSCILHILRKIRMYKAQLAVLKTCQYIDLITLACFFAQVDEGRPELFFRTIRKHVYY